MSISENLIQIKSILPENITLVAVSKTKPIEAILEAYQDGQRIFGENKIQEMTEKWEQLPKDIDWHMIGHVQSNKVKYMIPYVKLIHGVDSFKLLKEINRLAFKIQKNIDCLLQIYIATEETKFGLNVDELDELINLDEFKSMQNIKIVGLMGMASFTENNTQIINEFQNLKSIFDKNLNIKTNNFDLKILSMGMSGDYQLAIECGSNMIRIGSSIFGGR